LNLNSEESIFELSLLKKVDLAPCTIYELQESFKNLHDVTTAIYKSWEMEENNLPAIHFPELVENIATANFFGNTLQNTLCLDQSIDIGGDVLLPVIQDLEKNSSLSLSILSGRSAMEAMKEAGEIAENILASKNIIEEIEKVANIVKPPIDYQSLFCGHFKPIDSEKFRELKSTSSLLSQDSKISGNPFILCDSFINMQSLSSSNNLFFPTQKDCNRKNYTISKATTYVTINNFSINTINGNGNTLDQSIRYNASNIDYEKIRTEIDDVVKLIAANGRLSDENRKRTIKYLEEAKENSENRDKPGLLKSLSLAIGSSSREIIKGALISTLAMALNNLLQLIPVT